MHRTASVNEYSTRYSEAIDSRATTPPGEWRFQSKNNKQGSDGFLPEEHQYDPEYPDDLIQTGGHYLTERETMFHNLSNEIYKERLEAGVAREVARKDLPLSTYTEAYWKVDLHNLFHFLRLRLDPHAQQEIREFAEAIANIVREWVPAAWEAFEDYRLNGEVFSAQEMTALRNWIHNSEVNDYAFEDGDDYKGVDLKNLSDSTRKQWLEYSGLTNKREAIEFWNKIKIDPAGIPI